MTGPASEARSVIALPNRSSGLSTPWSTPPVWLSSSRTAQPSARLHAEFAVSALPVVPGVCAPAITRPGTPSSASVSRASAIAAPGTWPTVTVGGSAIRSSEMS
jgi:hypothetical protein